MNTPADPFVSKATTPDGVLNDFQSHMIRGEKLNNRINPSVGVTVQPRAAVTGEGLVENMRSLFAQRAIRRGGGLFNVQNYNEQRREFLTQHEGVRYTAYDDATGKPMNGQTPQGLVTVGVGFNMQRPGARQMWANAGVEEDFDAVYAGRQPLSQASVDKLLDRSLGFAENFVSQRFSGTRLRDYERLALVSLAFNNPSLIGPNLTRLVKDGDRAGAVDEILYRSNRTKHRGLARRRYHEAMQFAGQADVKLPKLSEYMSNFA